MEKPKYINVLPASVKNRIVTIKDGEIVSDEKVPEKDRIHSKK